MRGARLKGDMFIGLTYIDRQTADRIPRRTAMPLVNLKPVLREAKAKGYAVAAFNPVDYASMKAMVKAAEELNAPVIIQSSAKTIKYYGHKAMIGWMREIADDSPVPVVLHLDHGKDIEMIKKCVEMGWTSVMIDWSDKPFDVNLEQTQQGRRHGDEGRHRRRSRDRRDPRRRGRHGRGSGPLHRSQRSREVLPRARPRRVRSRDRHRARLLQGRAGREIRPHRRDQPPHEHADGAARRHGA